MKMSEVGEEKKKYGKYENYEIEHLAEKYMEIKECEKDEEKMKYVHECLKSKMDDNKKAISSIEELLKVGEAKRMEEKDEDGSN